MSPQNSLTDLFNHPTFSAAMSELTALGIHVTPRPAPGAIPYAIVGGRSNARWWLIPMENRHVTRSGLALFQPILPSARLMKHAAVTLTQLGLRRLWAKPRVYITGTPEIGRYFGGGRLSYAYFTGTDCPHRKIAVQIMDDRGNLKGFAKVTQNPAVSPLLAHEAATLNYLATLNLRTALIPKVLYHGHLGQADTLVTDTLKTPRSKTATTLQPAHLAFLKELAEKTSAAPPPPVIARSAATRQSSPPSGQFTHAILAQRYSAVAHRLSPEWQTRLQRALDHLEVHSQYLTPPTLTHGDFTPWNTFFVDGKLYVFDWEYAETDYPASNDLFHFLLATPGFRSNPPEWQVRQLTGQAMPHYGIDEPSAMGHLAAYLLSHTLRYVERLAISPGQLAVWEGERENAALLDVAYRM